MCRLLEVSPSGFYEWVQRPLSNRAIEDRRLLVLIRASYTASGGVYGHRRVHQDLREMARADVFDYIEVFYNRKRRHSHLGGVSPEVFEQASF